MRILFLLLVSIIYIVQSVPINNENYDSDKTSDEDMQGDADTNYYDEEDESPNKNLDVSTERNNNELPARILTPEEIFEKDIGESVTLGCKTPPNDESVIIWYNNNAILFQGTIAMSAKSNIKYHDDNSIEITDIQPHDDGQYKCQSVVSKNNVASVAHTLKVRVPPSVVELRAKDNQTVLSVGETLSLMCHANGYPEPVISWHKETIKDGKAFNERLGISGNALTIFNISRKDEGKYLCFADNKIGKPALSYINIELNHPPIVSIEKIIVNSDTELDTELKCTVKAKPTANVLWLRNGINLKSSEHVQLHNDENNHILILKGLKESDFGKYVCLAKNFMGTVEKSITLVKTPAVLEFIKPERPTKELVLTWKVESTTPITQHELQYRKKGESNWETVEPTVHEGEDGVYILKYTLPGLEEGIYETRSRSQNKHGWSEYTDITIVGGEKVHHGKHGNKKHHKHNKDKPITPPQDVELAQQPEKESKLGESKENSASSSSGCFIISSIALLYLYLNRL